MRVCSNCGAEYQKDLQNCPYCGLINESIVKTQHADKVNSLKKQKREIKKLPKIIPRKALKIMAKGALILLALFLVVIIIVFIGGKIKKNIDDNSQQKHIEVMDELLVKGDYQGFYDYYDKKVDYAYAIYDKYEELDEIYYLYTRMWWDLDSIREYGGDVSDEYIIDDCISAMNILRDICNVADELLNNSGRFGNEEHLEAIRDKSIEEFKDFMQVDDAVIEQIITVPLEDEEPDIYNELADMMLENLKSVDFGRE